MNPRPRGDMSDAELVRALQIELDAREKRLAASEARERQLAAVVESSHHAIVSKTLDGTITSWNAAATQLYGYTAEEAIGQPISLIIPRDRADEMRSILALIRRDEPVRCVQTIRRRKDGTRLPITLTVSPIRDLHGRIVGASAITQDDSDRTAVEHELRRSHAQLLAALEAGDMGTWTWEIGSPQIVWHQTLLRLWGLTGTETDTLDVDAAIALMHQDDRQAMRSALRSMLTMAQEPSGEYRILLEGGGVKWFAYRGRLERDEHGTPIRLIGVNIDITARKRAEEMRLQSQKLEALGTLASGIAHDFNNLLLAIRGNTLLARRAAGDGHEAEHFCDEINKAVTRATDLVHRIVDFGRPHDVTRDRVHLGGIVGEAVTLLRATTPASILIDVHVDKGAPTVAGDPSQIHQVLVNLVTNAAQAIGDRNGHIRIDVEAVSVTGDLVKQTPDLRAGPYARISVTDDGCGMDGATLERAFDPFFTTKGHAQGTGLGLWVVHGVVRAHGGAVTVYSRVHQGTTLRLYFPATAGATAAITPRPGVVPRGRGERVAYVDDEPTLVLVAEEILRHLGYVVAGYTEPARALADLLAHPGRFDVLVTDVAMPALSGFDLARELRGAGSRIPLVMTTGYIGPTDQAAADAVGAVALIQKPYTLEDLGRSLARIFGR